MTDDTLVTQLRSLDPARDAELPEASWNEMLDKVTAMPVRRRKPVWRRPLVTIPALAMLSAGAFLLTTAVAGDKVIEVHAADALRDPRGLEQDLGRQGLDARIVAVPSKDLTGKWVHLYLAPDDDMDMDTYWLLRSFVGLLDTRFSSVEERCPIGDCARTSLLEIPGRVEGPITLVVGREPRPGEEFWSDNFGMNELAPSGALWCYGLEEMTPEDAAETVRGLGYDVSWDHEKGNTANKVDAPPDGAAVVFAWFKGPAEVEIVTTSPEDAARYKTAEGTPTPEHPRSSAPWAPSCS